MTRALGKGKRTLESRRRSGKRVLEAANQVTPLIIRKVR